MYELLSSRAILGMFAKELEEVSPPAWVADVTFLNEDSDQFDEDYRWLDQNPAFREWIGGRQAVTLGTNKVIVVNRLYEATLRLNRRERMKDKTGQLELRIANLIQATDGRHWQQLLTPLFTNGASSASVYGTTATYDGVDFYGNGHRGAQDNALTISGFSARVTTAQAEEGVLQAIEAILGFTDEHGEPANEGASAFNVVCPPNLLGPVAAALRLEFLQGTSGTRQNVVGAVGEAMGFTWSLAANARMLGVTGWGTGATRKMVVNRTDNPIKPFIRQQAEGARVSAKAEGSEFEHDTNEHEYGVSAERGVGYGLWEHSVEVTFAV